MFLKRIEIFGFKSFADRSTIEFGDNISALIGPNGCGKSNIVDAVKWVLGEQSTKTLRAEKMEDVIFNGTENRKKLNVAEITLVLSNEEEILSLEVPEISVKRRLYRSGESVYYINNQAVKLKELRELFFDTGIGKSSYSIMEQGKIDQILSNKPEDRRHVFEEAAGITRYKIKGIEAERKLEKTEENMGQVENILKEVKRSYDSLKAQAEKTEQYRALREDLFQYELRINLVRLREFLERKEKKQQQLEEKKKERDALRATIAELNASLESNLDEVNTMETRLNETHRKIYGLELEKGNKDNQILLLQQQYKEIERQISSSESREQNIHQKITDINTQIQEKQKHLEELQSQIQDIHKNVEAFQNSLQYAENRIQENEGTITEREGHIQELEAEQGDREAELRELTDDIVTQLDERLKESGYSRQQRKEAEEKIQRRLDSLSISINGKLQLLEDVSALNAMEDTKREEIWNNSIQTLRETATGLDELTNEFQTFTEHLPTFLDEFLAPEGIITQKRSIDQQIEDIREKIQNHRTIIQDLREENKKLGTKIEEYRSTLEELRLNEVQSKTQVSNAEETLRNLKNDVAEQERLLEENRKEIEEGKNRLESIDKQILTQTEEREAVKAQEEELRKELAELEKTISQKNQELVEKEKSLKSSMGDTEKLQSEVEKLQMDLSSINTEVRNLQENFRENHSQDLMEYESQMYEIQEKLGDLRETYRGIKEDVKNLGHINLMAPEEFAEVKERYEFLTNQLEDLRKAREDLKQVTREIRKESTELFIETYEKIKTNFHTMFRRLFGGGRAEVKLLEPDQVLNSGIEIYAQPPGKKLENITLLSGGERSLTAVALLFAVYMVKPSPFCILDEIDAALDEENVGRFVNLLLEFSENSQFIIITHNKRTIAASRTLLGITMSEPGVSKVIAVRVDSEREKLVNEVIQ